MAGSRTCEFYKRAAIIENNGKRSSTLNAKNKLCNNVAEVGQINNASSGVGLTSRPVDSFGRTSNRFDLLSDFEHDVDDGDFYLSIDDMGFDKSFTSTPRWRKKLTRQTGRTYSNVVKEKLINANRSSELGDNDNSRGVLHNEIQSSYQPSPVVCSEYYKLIGSQKDAAGSRSKQFQNKHIMTYRIKIFQGLGMFLGIWEVIV